jgi:hypothetical protein
LSSLEETTIVDGVEENVPDLTSSGGIMNDMLNAFVAARIYSLRGITTIEDPEITKCCKRPAARISTKSVISELLSRIKDFISNHPELICPVIAKESITDADFFSDFCRLFSSTSTETFDQLAAVWAPITILLKKKGKLLDVCTHVADFHISCDDDFSQKISGMWINELLKLHQEKSGESFSIKLYTLLKKVIVSPNASSKLFLPR